MQLGLSEILGALTFILALVVQTWALNRFMLNRMDSHKEKLESKVEKVLTDVNGEVQHLHSRINQVKDEYVKRTDIDRDLNQIHQNVATVNTSLNQQMSAVNSRLDVIISAISKPPIV